MYYVLLLRYKEGISAHSPRWDIDSDTSNLMSQDKLKEVLTEIQLLKKEVQEECNKRRNAEIELHSALRKV